MHHAPPAIVIVGGRMKLVLSVIALVLIIAVAILPAAANSTYRGVNAGLDVLDEGGLDILAWEWGANLLRVFLPMSGWCPSVVPRDESALCCDEEELLELDWLIDECEERGIRVIIDVHEFPGFYYFSGFYDNRLWTDQLLQDAIVAFWQTIAARYADRGDVIYGYDLLNEPHEVDPDTWLALAQRIIDAIREIDPYHTVIVEGTDFADPKAFSSLVPVDDDNVIYSFHFYYPNNFTHQGIHEPYVGPGYPSEMWNEEYLRAILQPVREFQLRYNARILVGEFSVTSLAPTDSRRAYLQDVLRIFEEYGYDYAYWSFRQWGAQSLSHEAQIVPWGSGVIARYVGDTDALGVFKGFLALNAEKLKLEASSERGKCVFDESHWSENAVTNVRARELAWRLEGLITVEQHAAGRLSEVILDDVDLLVTGNPYSHTYDGSEVEAIQEFIQAGGSLLFYAGANPSIPTPFIPGVNTLLAPLGIGYMPSGLVLDVPASVDSVPQTFYTASASAAPNLIRFDTGHYYLSVAASLRVSAPAVPILVTGSDTWMDSNWDGVHGPGESLCPCAVIAIAEYGSGRAAVVSDQAFDNPCNWVTLKKIVAWLLRES